MAVTELAKLSKMLGILLYNLTGHPCLHGMRLRAAQIQRGSLNAVLVSLGTAKLMLHCLS